MPWQGPDTPRRVKLSTELPLDEGPRLVKGEQRPRPPGSGRAEEGGKEGKGGWTPADGKRIGLQYTGIDQGGWRAADGPTHQLAVLREGVGMMTGQEQPLVSYAMPSREFFQ